MYHCHCYKALLHYALSVTFSLLKYFNKLQRCKLITDGLTRLQYYTYVLRKPR